MGLAGLGSCRVMSAWSADTGVFVPEWVGELSPRTSVLAASEHLPVLLGHFRCVPGDPAWGEVNHVGDVAHVVFPRTAVQISPVGGPRLTADANRVLLYDAGQRYRRGLLDPRGDDCLFVALGPDAVARLGSAVVETNGTKQRFSQRDRSCPAGTYASLHRLRALSALPGDDELAVDELLLSLLEGVLGPSSTASLDDGPLPVAEAVRTVLAHCYRDRLTLPELASEVGVSPYHLHRRFRAVTGWTIHAYRDHLRLREGLARILDGEPDLSALAFDLGYASHSHFTSRFRRAFGATPSQVRRDGGVNARA